MVRGLSAPVLLSSSDTSCGSTVGYRPSDSVAVADAYHLYEWRADCILDGYGAADIASVLGCDWRHPPFEVMNRVPNKPAAGNAGITSRFTIEHHWAGVPEPERSAT